MPEKEISQERPGIVMKEAWLFLQLGEQDLKPVLFWIHGGGFFAGDGTDSFYGPQYLIQKDIVIVTINYRLGPLGMI